MIDHIGIRTTNFARLSAFYKRALAPLGYELIVEITAEMGAGYVGAGFGIKGKPDFWVSADARERIGAIHVAFVAADRKTVDAFHGAAIAAGGEDNGKPGPRPHYHPNYYGAFVLDPDGNNVEAVCHKAG